MRVLFDHSNLSDARYLFFNEITSIASGAFSGLGSLTELLVTFLCHITVGVFSHIAGLDSWTPTRSHRLRVAHSLHSGIWLFCMLQVLCRIIL